MSNTDRNQPVKGRADGPGRHAQITIETSPKVGERRVRVPTRVINLSESDRFFPNIGADGKGVVVLELSADTIQVLPAGKKAARRRAPRHQVADAERALAEAREASAKEREAADRQVDPDA